MVISRYTVSGAPASIVHIYGVELLKPEAGHASSVGSPAEDANTKIENPYFLFTLFNRVQRCVVEYTYKIHTVNCYLSFSKVVESWVVSRDDIDIDSEPEPEPEHL